jgi:hypothetical protein
MQKEFYAYLLKEKENITKKQFLKDNLKAVAENDT